MIRAVCFDLGGVMVKIRHSWAEVLDAMRSEVPEHLVGSGLAECCLLRDYQADQLTDDEYLGKLALHLHIQAENAGEAHGLILMEDYAGASQLVRDVQAKSLPAVCLSNTNALHFREFFSGRFPVCEAFDFLLSSHDVGASKPDPAIFAAMEDRLGLRGEEIAFFDDLPANVEGARSLGWRAEVVDPSSDPPGQIRSILRSWNVL